MTTVHFLKIWRHAFDKVKSGEKTLEVRTDDRTPSFETGDIVVLELYRPAAVGAEDPTAWLYQGQYEIRRIGYVERGEHVPQGSCAFQLAPGEDGDALLLEGFFDERPESRGKHMRLRFEVSK